MAPEKSNLKPPQPEKYRGEGQQRSPHYIDSWIQEVKDHFKLAIPEPTEEQKLLYLQYYLQDKARIWYNNYRQANEADTGKWTLDNVLAKLKEYFVPSTTISDIWTRYNNLSQTVGGKTRKITDLAIDLAQQASQLGDRVTDKAKIHRLLTAMHPKLRFQVEPRLSEDEQDYAKVVKIA